MTTTETKHTLHSATKVDFRSETGKSLMERSESEYNDGHQHRVHLARLNRGARSPAFIPAEPDRLTVRSLMDTRVGQHLERLVEHMAGFTVHQGKRYRATISLGMLERFASNNIIAGRLRTAGFTDVTVTGAGSTRGAEALWPAADATAELPKQILEVVEI